MHWGYTCRKDGCSSAFVNRVGGLICTAAVGVVLSLGTAKNAAAMSEQLVWIEHIVSSTTLKGAVFTEFLIIDDRTLLEAVRKERPQDAVINAHFALEKGASILSSSSPEKLDSNVNYLPLDFEVAFSKPGVFMGKIELEVQLGDRTLVDAQHFWVRYDGITSSFISYMEYVDGRLREAVPIKADPFANLEEGDVPGEGIRGPHECDTKRGLNRGPRCGL